MANASLAGRTAFIVFFAALALPFSAGEHLDFPLRGQHLTLTIYRPAGPRPAAGTIIMASGDVGWVGLSVSMSEFLCKAGYVVVGVNSREYLGAFTTRSGRHLLPGDVQSDYAELSAFLRGHGLLAPPVIVSGTSEGAGLAVLAAAAPGNRGWIQGVITMGLPAVNELAWRWADFTTWITKKDSREPSFAAVDYLPAISPVGLYMIQSTHDEYVTEHDYRAMESAAKPPRQLAVIQAANHRFTDKIPELRSRYLAGLSWLQAAH